MNPIAEDMQKYLGSAQLSDEEFLEHYGIKRRSGRYPWGSGKDPYQHDIDFLGRIEKLKEKGWTETPENIMKEFGLSSTQYRREKSLCQEERQIYRIATAKRLRDKEGLGATEIAKRMGIKNESTVRGWFEQDEKGEIYRTRKVAEFLKDHVDKDKMVDVGKNQEIKLNISRERLDNALLLLKRYGYNVYSGRIASGLNKNQLTTQTVLCVPGVKQSEIYNYNKVKTLDRYITRDDCETFEKKFHYPTSMDSKRLQIRYAEDGGTKMDGVVELRRNVPDLDLRGSRYAQVRILVDGTHYIKGMAVYADDLPDGIDVRFNTNKTKDKTKLQCLKEIKNDPENPFGSAIKDVELGGQYWYDDPKTGKKKLGLINKRADEGDWTEWKDTLPSQFLSKQSRHMAKQQLDLAVANKAAEFDAIMSLTNPTIKKYYLEDFAGKCDSAAVDLKAAALPGQKYHVIIPNNTLKDNEVYAPGYKDGTKLALIRYPHGGTFEIPVCTVTTKNALGKKLIGSSSIDAICINHNVAERLSGADFDGDTVMCIPTDDPKGKVKITRSDRLKGLIGFDNKALYGTEERIGKDGKKHYYNGDREIKVLTGTDNEMGKISNLITDMTLQGANSEELARAVRHSMVVIDAEKHKLDYKKSYIDNGIQELKDIYQPKLDENGNRIPNTHGGGAFTLISSAKSPEYVNKRKGQPRINQKGKSWYDPSKPEGSLIYFDAPDNELYYAVSKYNKKTHTKTVTTEDGKTISYDMNNKKDVEKYEPVMRKDNKGNIYFTNKDKTIKYMTEKRTMKSSKMAEATDARTLVSTHNEIERLYADFANTMKDMANKARVEMLNTPRLKYNKNAAKIYSQEVSTLNADLNKALLNSIKERDAKRKTASEMAERVAINPQLKGEDLRKVETRVLDKYRKEIGAIPRRKRSIQITDKEWEAIQAGAISDDKLKTILRNSDPDVLRERAMPKNKKGLSTAQINRIKAMDASNFTISQIAEKLGISKSTVSNVLKGVK